ncbi:hypothetical protein MTR67_005967 [Solanum verrucosum]|uniref:Uncharacterized protein n=1 Tax=Solanum verrucosum TaxID=315347 RepID=A0AAF0PXB6_SOLVR|nr:hypothetical protein MTR67_005967 [Solanum verrucosum]
MYLQLDDGIVTQKNHHHQLTWLHLHLPLIMRFYQLRWLHSQLMMWFHHCTGLR